MYSCSCPCNCCTTILINVKFAVTMLLCPQTWGLRCDDVALYSYFWGFMLTKISSRTLSSIQHVGGVHLRILSVYTCVSRVERCLKGHPSYRNIGSTYRPWRREFSRCGKFTAVHIQLRYVNLVNAIGRTFNFRSTTVRRGCPFVVSLTLFLAIAFEGLR